MDSVPAHQLCSSHRDRIHTLLTHTHIHKLLIHSHSTHTHTHIHTQTPHSLLTHTHPHTLLTHPYTCLTITHTYTLHTHTTSHTPHSPTHTHTHTSPSHTHTQIQTQSLQEHTHRKHGDPGAVLKHQARGACGNSPESQLRSVAGASTHWEPLGPRNSLREWRGLRLTQLGPEQTSLLCKICHN